MTVCQFEGSYSSRAVRGGRYPQRKLGDATWRKRGRRVRWAEERARGRRKWHPGRDGEWKFGRKRADPHSSRAGAGDVWKAYFGHFFFLIFELSQTFLWRVKPPIQLQIATSVSPTFNIDLKSNNRWFLDLIQKSHWVGGNSRKKCDHQILP